MPDDPPSRLGEPPASPDEYGVYAVSLILRGVNVRVGEPGEATYRAVEVGIGHRATADSRSLFTEFSEYAGRSVPVSLPSGNELEWCVRIIYERATPLEQVESNVEIYSNILPDEQQPITTSWPSSSSGDLRYEYIFCVTLQQALKVAYIETGVDLASEFPEYVFPQDTISHEQVPLDDSELFRFVGSTEAGTGEAI